MTDKQTVRCNECNEHFDIDVKTKKHPNDIIETYFTCEHCYHHYTSYVDNKRVRKLRRKLDSMLTDKQGAYLDKDKSIGIRTEISQTVKELTDNMVSFGRADI